MKPQLPHAYPFQLIDRVVQVEAGRLAVAIKNLSAADPLVDGDGRISTTLLAEAMAQCAGIALAPLRPDAMAFLARIDRLRCLPSRISGARLEIRAQITRIFGQTVKARCVIRADGRRCAAAEIILQFASRDSATSPR